jgi:hypothetical protein
MADDPELRRQARRFAPFCDLLGKGVLLANPADDSKLDDEMELRKGASATKDEISQIMIRECGRAMKQVAGRLMGMSELAALADEAMGLTESRDGKRHGKRSYG